METDVDLMGDVAEHSAARGRFSDILRHGRVPLLVLLLGHFPLAGVFFWQRLQQGAFQAGVLAFLALFVIYPLRCSRRCRWTRLCSLFVLLDVICLTVGSLMNFPWLVAMGLVFLTAAWGLSSIDVALDRSLVCLSFLPLSVTMFPDSVNSWFGARLVSVITSLTSLLATRWEVLHFRDGTRLAGTDGSLDMVELCGSWPSWYPLLLLTLVWLISQRRSLIQSVCLLVCCLPISMVSLIFAGSVVLSGRVSGSLGDVSPSWTTGIMLIFSSAFVLCADALVLFVTAPVKEPEGAGEEKGKNSENFDKVLINPLSVWWNVVISAVPMLPLAFDPVAHARLPIPLRNACIFLIPIVLAFQAWSFLTTRH